MLFAFAAAFAAPVEATPTHLRRQFAVAAEEAGVPDVVLLAVAYEASGLREHRQASTWGGRTMFDFVESDEVGGPDLERAAIAADADVDDVLADWRVATRAAAALLAEHARNQNGGELPAVTQLDAWQGAVAAFSGRQEPLLQAFYVEAIYTLLEGGFTAHTRWGELAVAPQDVTVNLAAPLPPGSTDYAGAEAWVPACEDNYSDYSRGGSSIDLIVIHTVQGSYSGCASWFANCSAGASAHYVVSDEGDVTQMVREADVAWHAGNWDYNERSVGIEHEGYVSDCSDYTDALYRGSAALASDIAARQGVPLDRSHFIGHDEVPDPDGSGYGGSGNHTDPGSCWDWDYYMSLVGGAVSGEVLGYVRADDIYNTEGNLVGASAWIAETGDTTTVGADGLYHFPDLAYGTYTVHASIEGYAEGTCTATLADTQKWCSIALLPGGGDTGSGDTGNDDTGADTGTDTGEGDTDTDTDGEGARPRIVRPGTPTPLDEVAGCDSAGQHPSWAWGLLAAVPLMRRRR